LRFGDGEGWRASWGRGSPGGEPGLNAGGFVFHGLGPVGAGSKVHGGKDAGGAQGVDGFMAAAHGGEDFVPLAFNVGAVGVENGLEPGVGEDFFAGGDIGREGDADSEGDDAEIEDDFHEREGDGVSVMGQPWC